MYNKEVEEGDIFEYNGADTQRKNAGAGAKRAKKQQFIIDMEIDFFLFQHGMERLDTGIVIRIPITTERMLESLTVQIFFKCLARILVSKVAVQEEPLCIPDIQARILYSLYC